MHFAHLSYSLLEDLLGNTRSVEKSMVTRVFQNTVLGSKDFEAVYGMPPLFEGESCLKTFDKLMLDTCTCMSRSRRQSRLGILLCGVYGAAVLAAKGNHGDVCGDIPLRQSRVVTAGF